MRIPTVAAAGDKCRAHRVCGATGNPAAPAVQDADDDELCRRRRHARPQHLPRGDNSPSDRLIINGGTASGKSGLRITNTGGSGGLTLGNGIPVVVATNGGTTASGAFGLSGPVVAGPYEYFLFRGGITPGNENDWFLRNVAGPIPPEPPGPTPADPAGPDPSGPSPTRHPVLHGRPCRSRSSVQRRSSMLGCRRWRA